MAELRRFSVGVPESPLDRLKGFLIGRQVGRQAVDLQHLASALESLIAQTETPLDFATDITADPDAFNSILSNLKPAVTDRSASAHVASTHSQVPAVGDSPDYYPAQGNSNPYARGSTAALRQELYIQDLMDQANTRSLAASRQTAEEANPSHTPIDTRPLYRDEGGGKAERPDLKTTKIMPIHQPPIVVKRRTAQFPSVTPLASVGNYPPHAMSFDEQISQLEAEINSSNGAIDPENLKKYSPEVLMILEDFLHGTEDTAKLESRGYDTNELDNRNLRRQSTSTPQKAPQENFDRLKKPNIKNKLIRKAAVVLVAATVTVASNSFTYNALRLPAKEVCEKNWIACGGVRAFLGGVDNVLPDVPLPDFLNIFEKKEEVKR